MRGFNTAFEQCQNFILATSAIIFTLFVERGCQGGHCSGFHGLLTQLRVGIFNKQCVFGVKFGREVFILSRSLSPKHIQHFSVHQSKPED